VKENHKDFPERTCAKSEGLCVPKGLTRCILINELTSEEIVSVFLGGKSS